MTEQDAAPPGPNRELTEAERAEAVQTERPGDGSASVDTLPPAAVTGTDPALATKRSANAAAGYPVRLLNDYDVDIPNSPLVVEAIDEPGPGGACHHYCIYGRSDDAIVNQHIEFQEGGLAEAGVNGITNEALLAIVADRLRGFQSGPFRCPENAAALTHVECALAKLLDRTRARRARGVEGQSVA